MTPKSKNIRPDLTPLPIRPNERKVKTLK